jgi:hypothetical protein
VTPQFLAAAVTTVASQRSHPPPLPQPAHTERPGASTKGAAAHGGGHYEMSWATVENGSQP